MPRRNGDISKKVTVGNARYRMWRSMRILRRFTAPDLIATAAANRDNVARYVRGLVEDGYLKISTPKRDGIKGGHIVYVLARDTGPNPPRIGKFGVFDPNLQIDEAAKVPR